MLDRVLPDYRGGSIVNLMSSIGNALGWKSRYPELRLLSSSTIKSKKIVLIVIDGLGYEWLSKNGKGSIFERFLIGSMTTVFPATTAAAINTFVTGVAPQQHAVTGWFMYLREIGILSIPLRFIPRIGGLNFESLGISKKEIFSEKSLYSKIKVKSFIVTAKNIAGKNKKMIAYKSLKGMFKETGKLCKKSGRRYIYSYWPKFDSLCHEFGVDSPKVKKHFKELCKEFEMFISNIKDTETTIILTADHGLINVKETVKLDNHPKFKECLALPLSGDSRTAYCYVRPSKVMEFEKYFAKNFASKFEIHKSEELIKKNYFGIGKINPKLIQRIGDYVIIAKNNSRIRDSVLGEKPHNFIGHHSGLSREEMLVPLVLVRL